MTLYKRRSKYVPPEMYESWGGQFMPKRYKVKYRDTWVTPRKAALVGESLHYELWDNTQGVAKPGEWHEEGKPVSKPAVVDPKCTICGDERSRHEEEPPYPCYDCGCKGFSYAPVKSTEDDDNILEI